MQLFASFSTLIYLAVGIGIGLTLFPKKFLKWNSKLQVLGIALLLFAMGASLGGSPTLLEDIKSAGGQAILFALATIAGSVLMVYLLTRLFLDKKKEKK